MHKGVMYGLGSAALFGVSTPVAKLLVGTVPPLMLAGLLYTGSGLGLLFVLAGRAWSAGGARSISFPRPVDWLWLAGAITLGGILGPIALMYGLTSTPASTASLLLNLEGVFTALLAWFWFRENFDRRIAIGMLAIVGGGAILVWAPAAGNASTKGAAFIAAACLCWALDNNLTRKVSSSDAVMIAAAKGLIAGIVSMTLALGVGLRLPGVTIILAAAAVGFLGYGVSLVLFVLALRQLGSARAGAYFSVAPFFGAAVAVLVEAQELSWQLPAAGALMALGVWLHVTERHTHEHAHELLEHNHSHSHDDQHHQHVHESWDGREPHTHSHIHPPTVHSHSHYPDIHHRHPH